jgi:hypothetical protein
MKNIQTTEILRKKERPRPKRRQNKTEQVAVVLSHFVENR